MSRHFVSSTIDETNKKIKTREVKDPVCLLQSIRERCIRMSKTKRLQRWCVYECVKETIVME